MTPAARAVAMAWATIRPAPLPEPDLPARGRIPAMTGAARSVLMVAANGEKSGSGGQKLLQLTDRLCGAEGLAESRAARK
ncbi:MAG: hypothetical protein QOF66_7443 [Mycobacterium sp.]|nr:hypothetical protein [Mycobacterium sp.]MDT5059077.1 hypothetical protein [Mycobacterium sp.]